MEAVQWVYQKVVALGYDTTTGRLMAVPSNKIIIYETDHDPLKTKDGQFGEMPTVTVSVIRDTQSACYTVYNAIRAVISSDIANGIRHASIVGREIYEHDKMELYRMDIEIEVKQNI